MTKRISVKTNQLTRRFGKFVAVDMVSIEVHQGEIFGFLGANGAGKTTLIRMLCGLLEPSEGTATIAGYDVYHQAEAIKKNIGYMSQRFSLYQDLTVEENINFYGGIYGLPKSLIESRKNAFLERVELNQFKKVMTKDLPLGFKQRLALGCALIHDPPILFLDEPTSGIDPEARRNFWNLLYETVEQGKTIFVTTHFMDEAEYCHRVGFMRQGKLVATGTASHLEEVYRKSTMQEVFLTLSRVKEKIS